MRTLLVTAMKHYYAIGDVVSGEQIAELLRYDFIDESEATNLLQNFIGTLKEFTAQDLKNAEEEIFILKEQHRANGYLVDSLQTQVDRLTAKVEKLEKEKTNLLKMHKQQNWEIGF